MRNQLSSIFYAFRRLWSGSHRHSRGNRRRQLFSHPAQGFFSWGETLEIRTLLSASAIGGEIRANTYTTGNQSRSSVATDPNGNYVIAWQSAGQDGSGYGIYAQRYNADGVPQGTEFRVNSFSGGDQRLPAIGMDADGDFVVTWQSPGQDGSGYGTYAQRYNADGVPQGTEFRVNSFTLGSQFSPAIGMDADGDFVVTWQSTGQDESGLGIYAQRYDVNGVAQGTEFRVNSFTNGDQKFPAIGMDTDGDFVVTWESYAQDGSGFGVYAQRYNSDGVPQGTEFRVNSFTTNWQLSPTIGMDADGDFVVSWKSYTQDGLDTGIYAQRYNADGVSQGNEFRVNSFTSNFVYAPAIGLDADGDFVVTWQNVGQDGNGFDIYAQLYNAEGVPQGNEFRANSFTTGSQSSVSIGMDADGDFVITWQSAAQDGSGYGIYAQRYIFNTILPGHNSAPVLTVSGTASLNSISTNIPSTLNAGTLVSDLIARMSPSGGITDSDPGALQGIAINGLGGTASGDWQFTTDGGVTWQPIGTTGNDDARLLAADSLTRIRFQPHIGFKGTVRLAFVAWDQTYGVNGEVGVTKNRSGESPFSLAYDYATLEVSNVAPILNASGTPQLDLVPQKFLATQIPGTLVSEIITRMAPQGGISDADFGAQQGIAINGLTGISNGTWEYTVNNGTNWAPISTTGNGNARLLASDPHTRIRFVPNADFHGEAKIAFVAWDRTSGSNGGVANVSSRGGTTPFSLNYEYAGVTVANLAPVLVPTGTASLDAIDSEDSSGGTGTLVSSILQSIQPSTSISDLNSDSIGIAINGVGGVANGTWQYSRNRGGTWTDISATGNSNALLLSGIVNNRIRFVPNPGFKGTVKFAFVLWDQTAGNDGDTVNVASRGGNSPFSLAYDYASIVVS